MCCCRMSVQPLVPEIAVAILTVGQFKPNGILTAEGLPISWRREIPEEGAAVMANIGNGEALELSIDPAISILAHHAGKRITAGVYFEIAAKYAEKVNGVVIQKATVASCVVDGKELVLASYPEMPLSFARVCIGFRQVILGVDAA